MQPIARVMPIFALVLVVLGILSTVALWRLADEAGKRACIEAAQAKYPAVAVPAFERNRSATGPLKVSSARERAAAVDDCD